MKYVINFIFFIVGNKNQYNFKVHYIFKGFFHDQYLIKVFKRVESKAPLTWTWKKCQL
jgi:hypothetical protein